MARDNSQGDFFTSDFWIGFLIGWTLAGLLFLS